MRCKNYIEYGLVCGVVVVLICAILYVFQSCFLQDILQAYTELSKALGPAK